MTSPIKPPPASGTEIMLRSLGLDGVIGAAKELANAGSVARIMAFANDAGELATNVRTLGARLDRLEAIALAIADKLNIELPAMADGGGPGAGPGPDPGGPGTGGQGADPEQPRAA